MDQYSQDFNMSSSGSLPSFSIPNASTQASSFNSYQTPYNSSEYIHVSRIEEIMIKSFENIADRVVERVELAVEKHINHVLTAMSQNTNVPVSLDSSLTSDISHRNARTSLDQIYTPEIISRIKNDPNYHGPRSVGKTKHIVNRITDEVVTLGVKSQILMASRDYLTTNNDPLMLSGDEEEIQRDLGDRYEATCRI
ncbi:hypothetical protein INT48_001097 [Thamnidium elegans]|uniref:Uncharacterized protein n=1 Tax=Thamnidium elegans TaxID=101142 RepID=A0A8H7SHR7_9FUNG|nr:hypothetical protein INT48_001097 [Thamnidium elegans]